MVYRVGIQTWVSLHAKQKLDTPTLAYPDLCEELQSVFLFFIFILR